jgi:hypothetical protein
MYRFVFEYVSRREIDAQSEEEARVKLAQQVVLEEEWELIDVWSAEEPNAHQG